MRYTGRGGERVLWKRRRLLVLGAACHAHRFGDDGKEISNFEFLCRASLATPIEHCI